MKQIAFVFFLAQFVLASIVFSQSSMVAYGHVTYNNFSMESLKGFQRELLHDLTSSNIPAKIVDEYPAYYGVQGGLLVHVDVFQFPFSVGGFFDYTSTGARIHYQDYSGEVKFDQQASAVSLGGIVDAEQILSEYFQIDYTFKGRLIFSGISLNSIFRVGGSVQDVTLKFSSVSVAVEPGLTLQFNVIGGASVGLAGSYLIAFPSSLEYDQQENAFLINKKGERVTIDWSGFKLGFGVYYIF